MKTVKCCFIKHVYYPGVVVGIHTPVQVSTYEVSHKESGGFKFSNSVSNSAHTDWNINVQKDESSNINQVQSTVTNKTIQMDI